MLQRLLRKGLDFQALETGLSSIKLGMPKLDSKEPLSQLEREWELCLSPGTSTCCQYIWNTKEPIIHGAVSS